MKSRRNKQDGSAATAAGPSRPADAVTRTPSLEEGISAEELALVEEMEREVSALQARPSRKLEVAIALGLVLLCVAGLIGSRLIGVRTETGGIDPRWWPTVMCGIALALSILLAVIAFIRPPFDREDLEVTNHGGWIRLAWTIVLSALYIVAWSVTGNFVIPSVILLVALMWVYDGRGWKALVIFPVATVAGIYLLFHTLLKVPL